MGQMILVPGADFSTKNLGRAVQTDDELPVEAIFIYGPQAVIGECNLKVKFSPTFTTQRQVNWSIISGNQYANIDSSGHVTVLSGASNNTVIVRCSSVNDPDVYTDKILTCTEGQVVYYDYLVSDGSAYITIPNLPMLLDSEITVKYTVARANGYTFSWNSDSITNAVFASYLQSNGTTSRIRLGSLSYNNITTSSATGRKYRVVLHTSTSTSQNNSSCICYDDNTDDILAQYSGFSCYLYSVLALFISGSSNSPEGTFTPSEDTYGQGKFYELSATKGGVKIIDLRPATIDGTPCVIDTISGNVYYNQKESGLVAAND